MKVSDMFTNSGTIIVVITATITLFINIFRMFKSTSIEKNLETYNQTLTRHVLTCVLWWLIIIIGVLYKFSFKKWSKSDVSFIGLLSLVIFLVIIFVYYEYQLFTSGFKKKFFLFLITINLNL